MTKLICIILFISISNIALAGGYVIGGGGKNNTAALYDDVTSGQDISRILEQYQFNPIDDDFLDSNTSKLDPEIDQVDVFIDAQNQVIHNLNSGAATQIDKPELKVTVEHFINQNQFNYSPGDKIIFNTISANGDVEVHSSDNLNALNINELLQEEASKRVVIPDHEVKMIQLHNLNTQTTFPVIE